MLNFRIFIPALQGIRASRGSGLIISLNLIWDAVSNKSGTNSTIACEMEINNCKTAPARKSLKENSGCVKSISCSTLPVTNFFDLMFSFVGIIPIFICWQVNLSINYEMRNKKWWINTKEGVIEFNEEGMLVKMCHKRNKVCHRAVWQWWEMSTDGKNRCDSSESNQAIS